MIRGVHAIIFSKQAKKVRSFFRDVLRYRYVDAGDGWLIFALLPAELAIHPTKTASHELYFICDNIQQTVAQLKRQGVRMRGGIKDAGWGLLTTLLLPDGSTIGLYEPRHVSPLRIKSRKRARAQLTRANKKIA